MKEPNPSSLGAQEQQEDFDPWSDDQGTNDDEVPSEESAVTFGVEYSIRRIHLLGYGVKMDDPNITMEEYIRLEEEKTYRRDFNDKLTSEIALLYEPMVSPLNDNQMDFRIPFDESDDEDYTPTISYFDDLDYFKDFEKEFPAIVYYDALTSKLNFLTEPTEPSEDDVGEVSTIWNSCSLNLHEESLPSKISEEFIILILLNPVF
ncbi:hypothetical protein Tco_0199913 [Tanacetum coccineum]